MNELLQILGVALIGGGTGGALGGLICRRSAIADNDDRPPVVDPEPIIPWDDEERLSQASRTWAARRGRPDAAPLAMGYLRDALRAQRRGDL